MKSLPMTLRSQKLNFLLSPLNLNLNQDLADILQERTPTEADRIQLAGLNPIVAF